MIRRSPSPIRDNFTILPNETIEDSRLSWEARGLLTYLLSKPDHWQVIVGHLATESPKAKKEKVLSILKELELAGYVTNNGQFMSEDGKWTHTDRVVHEVCISPDGTVGRFTVHGNSVNGSTVDGEVPHLVSTDSKQELIKARTDKRISVASANGEASVSTKSKSKAEKGALENTEAVRLANLLADEIKKNGSKRPTVTDAWVYSIEKMLRIDERDPAEVQRAILWVTGHDFWSANILSPEKLRTQYDRIRLQAIQEKKKQRPGIVSAIQDFLSGED